MAEKEITKHLTVVQRRAYLHLKTLLKSKDNLSGLFKSYHLKTAFLWTVEETDPQLWDEAENNMLLCIKKIWTKMCCFYSGGFIPNYFLREQNVLMDLSSEELEEVNSIFSSIDLQDDFLATFSHDTFDYQSFIKNKIMKFHRIKTM